MAERKRTARPAEKVPTRRPTTLEELRAVVVAQADREIQELGESPDPPQWLWKIGNPRTRYSREPHIIDAVLFDMSSFGKIPTTARAIALVCLVAGAFPETRVQSFRTARGNLPEPSWVIEEMAKNVRTRAGQVDLGPRALPKGAKGRPRKRSG